MCSKTCPPSQSQLPLCEEAPIVGTPPNPQSRNGFSLKPQHEDLLSFPPVASGWALPVTNPFFGTTRAPFFARRGTTRCDSGRPRPNEPTAPPPQRPFGSDGPVQRTSLGVAPGALGVLLGLGRLVVLALMLRKYSFLRACCLASMSISIYPLQDSSSKRPRPWACRHGELQRNAAGQCP